VSEPCGFPSASEAYCNNITTTINNVQRVYNNHNGSVTRGIIFIVCVYTQVTAQWPYTLYTYIGTYMHYMYIPYYVRVSCVYTHWWVILLNIVRKRDTTTPLRGGSDRSSPSVLQKRKKNRVHKTSKRA